jgi:hypothetical protein
VVYPARSRKMLTPLLWGATLFVSTALSAHGQAPAVAPVGAPAAAPQTPQTPPQPSTEQQPNVPQTQEQAANQEQNESQAPQGAAGGESAVASAGTPNFKGDFLGLPRALAVPGIGTRSGTSPFGSQAPAVVTRAFKVAEDENPRPQDRVFVDFNFYDDVAHEFNERFNTGFHDIQVYRETFGVEKTFLDGAASVELRVPLNSAHIEDDRPGENPSDTDIGDLTVVFKAAPWIDPQTGNVLSGGLAVTAPTGPSHFANSPAFPGIRDTILVPFVGGIWRSDRFYSQMFLSMDIPSDERDVTIFHTDVQVGYFLMTRNDPDAFLTSVVPVFEVHVNDPLNHRGVFTLTDPFGTDDAVVLTPGLHFGLANNVALGTAVAIPVTGPKPFEIEAIVQLDWFFGCRGAGRGAATPNPFGY